VDALVMATLSHGGGMRCRQAFSHAMDAMTTSDGRAMMDSA
jgi:hypothetical protein